jgi:hypothetical protein
MNRLVVIRVGEEITWRNLHSLGRWSSPENHFQAARSLFVEGYNVVAVFVGRGDIPLATAKVTNVRERLIEDSIFPSSNDLGSLMTIVEFDPSLLSVEFSINSYVSILQYIRYMVGSQIIIPNEIARSFLNLFFVTSSIKFQGNTTYIVPESINYII